MWKDDRGFVFFDFNSPDALREDLRKSFDMIVVDPPFITEEVWRKYAIASKLLLKPGIDESTGLHLGKVILTTIYENKDLLKELLGAEPTVRAFFFFYIFTQFLDDIFFAICRRSYRQFRTLFISTICLPTIQRCHLKEKMMKYLSRTILTYIVNYIIYSVCSCFKYLTVCGLLKMF